MRLALRSKPVCWSILLSLAASASAAEPATPQSSADKTAEEKPAAPAAAKPAVNLTAEQTQVAAKFSEHEQLLIKMAETHRSYGSASHLAAAPGQSLKAKTGPSKSGCRRLVAI